MNYSTLIITSVIAALPGIVASIIGYLVLRNQKLQEERFLELKDTVRRHDTDIETIKVKFGDCKIDCTQNFVTTEQFVREAGLNRRSQERTVETLARVEGTLQVFNRIPEISGQIAAAIINEMKKE